MKACECKEHLNNVASCGPMLAGIAYPDRERDFHKRVFGHLICFDCGGEVRLLDVPNGMNGVDSVSGNTVIARMKQIFGDVSNVPA